MKNKISYPGNKGVRTIIPNLINLVPPHKKYVELCLGSGGLSRHLQLPSSAIGVEIDKSVIKKFKPHYPRDLVVVNDCAISYLEKMPRSSADTFIYADPPYIKSSRRDQADIYNYEWTDEMHSRFLHLLKQSPGQVAISTYPSEMYDSILKEWNKKIFCTSVHGHKAYEVVYYNYAPGGLQHQYNFVGKDKTDRQRIKRKISRWCNRLNELPLPERVAIYNYLSCSVNKTK